MPTCPFTSLQLVDLHHQRSALNQNIKRKLKALNPISNIGLRMLNAIVILMSIRVFTAGAIALNWFPHDASAPLTLRFSRSQAFRNRTD